MSTSTNESTIRRRGRWTPLQTRAAEVRGRAFTRFRPGLCSFLWRWYGPLTPSHSMGGFTVSAFGQVEPLSPSFAAPPAHLPPWRSPRVANTAGPAVRPAIYRTVEENQTVQTESCNPDPAVKVNIVYFRDCRISVIPFNARGGPHFDGYEKGEQHHIDTGAGKHLTKLHFSS